MPCPFTGPKMFWAGPKFFARQKDALQFSKIGFCAGTKVFEEALNAVKFLDPQKIWTGTKHFATFKRTRHK